MGYYFMRLGVLRVGLDTRSKLVGQEILQFLSVGWRHFCKLYIQKNGAHFPFFFRNSFQGARALDDPL